MNSIGVKGINSVTLAEGIGSVRFELEDDDGKAHEIVLKNVLYLPEASKNLISILQSSDERNDNCGIMPRGNHFLFMWNND